MVCSVPDRTRKRADAMSSLGAADCNPKPFDLEYLDQAISIQISANQYR